MWQPRMQLSTRPNKLLVVFVTGLLALAATLAGLDLAFCAEPAKAEVVAPPAEVVKALKLAPFYKRYLAVDGFAIVSSEHVSDDALREAADIVRQMLADRPDILKAIVGNKIRLAIMSPTEQTTDIPEHSDLKPKEYWDRRARGLGATSIRPAVSCGEENLLNLQGDRYPRENILVHEFAHVIHQMGLMAIDESFDRRLEETYQQAMDQGLWEGAYAATNHHEYWAEGVQSYFDTNDANNHQHNDIDTREKLAEYDPRLFALIDEVFKQSKWRYTRYDQRQADLAAQQSATPPDATNPAQQSRPLTPSGS